MADDNTLRSYRSNNSHRRSEHQVDAQADDPLAELVRLIGQPDPFTDNAPRYPQRPAPRAPQARHDQTDDSVGDWRRHVQRPTYDTREEPAFDPDPRYPSEDPYEATRQSPLPSFAADHDPYRIASQQSDPGYAVARRDPRADYRQEPALYASHPDYADEPMFAADSRQRAGAALRGDEDYDDPPRRKRGGSSLAMAVVLIGCAMLGTAGAYTYRTFVADTGSKQTPVIIADTAPSKVVPATRKSTRSQDRGGAQGGDERLVSREEQPVNLPTPGAVPRVVFPSPVQSPQQVPTSTGSTPPPRASNAQANPAAGASPEQPKRVRTVTIRPEGDNSAGQPFGDVPAPPAARTAVPPAAPRATRDEPLSLNPAAPQASPPPRAREAAPSEPRLASIPPAATGGYMVQVSSQRSESDAQASFRALQEKYSQLRSRQLVVRRADLGSRGIYYRAMVGPFGSSDEANQFCSSLKQSGGQCIIQRN